MTHPRDRLLEYALERLHEKESGPDLAARVARRHAEGDTGPELPSDFGNEAPPVPAPRGLRRLGIPAALAATAAVAFLYFNAPAPPGPPSVDPPPPAGPILARSDQDLELRRAGGEQAQASLFLDGDVLIVRDRAVSLELETGRIEALPGTVLALGGTPAAPTVELSVGTLRAYGEESASTPLLLRTRRTSLTIAPAGAVVCSVLPEDGAADPLEEFLAGDRGTQALHLRFEALAGSARLVFGGFVEELEPGTAHDLAVEPKDGEDRVLHEGRVLTALLEDFFDPTRRFALQRIERYERWMEEEFQALAYFLNKRERRWIPFERWVNEQLTEPLDPRFARLREAVAAFLSHEESEASLALARDMWLRAPSAFRVYYQLALAERGAFEFERELLAYLDNAVQDSSSYGNNADLARVGVWAALGGQAAGISALESLFDSSDFEVLDSFERFLICSTLDIVGHPTAAEIGREAIRSTTFSALALEDLDGARTRVLEAEFVQHLLASESPRISRIERGFGPFAAKREEALSSEAAIRRLLDSL